jgi:cytochrome c biogenesis protein CcmG/thiol:disulfide interchange protein DsbE
MKRGLMTYRYFIFKSLNKLFFLILLCFLGCDNGTAQRKVEKKSITTSKNTRTNKKVQKVNATMAPDFTLADLEGNWVSMNQFKGKVVLLNFWGTWCGPCRREIPDFVKLSEKYKDDGLEIVGVTLTSGPPKRISSFADQWGINYTLLTDIDGNETQSVTALYGQVTGRRISGVPTTFLIDRDGYIRQKYVGPRSEAVFYKDLKPYL